LRIFKRTQRHPAKHLNFNLNYTTTPAHVAVAGAAAATSQHAIVRRGLARRALGDLAERNTLRREDRGRRQGEMKV
jgi:hypothetical protein